MVARLFAGFLAALLLATAALAQPGGDYGPQPTPFSPSAVAITGGSVNGTTVGAATASTGQFTTLASGHALLTGDVLSAYSASTQPLEVAGDGGFGLSYASQYTADATGPLFATRKARGSLASPAAVASADTAGQLNIEAYDGGAFRTVAEVVGTVQTFTGSNNISGSLVFGTRPIGAAASLVQVFALDQNQHRASLSAAVPVVSACGTNSIDTHATDSGGQVNITAGTPATCTVTFKIAYATWDHCWITPEATTAVFQYSYTLAALVFTGTALAGKYDYNCEGQ